MVAAPELREVYMVKDLVGITFINGGRDIKIGVDCWGLVMEVCKRYGIDVPDFTIDSFAFEKINILAGKEVRSRKWERVHQVDNTTAPLVVLMRMHPIHITHAGVYIGNNKIIHTMKGTGVIISRADALKTRIVGYYRPC